MKKGTEVALRIISSLAALTILFIVAVLILGDDKPTLVTGLWFFGACAVLFFAGKKLGGSSKDMPYEFSKPKQKSSTIGIVAVGLGVASVVMPYFAAVFFVPATFICGAVAIRQGDRKLGGIAVVLAIVGVIGIIAVSNQIDTAQRDLERNLRLLQ